MKAILGTGFRKVKVEGGGGGVGGVGKSNFRRTFFFLFPSGVTVKTHSKKVDCVRCVAYRHERRTFCTSGAIAEKA